MSKILKNIAIIGASGSVGKPTVEGLLKTGNHNITAITRSSSQAKFPDGVEVRKGDYDDEAFMQSALAGKDVLIIMLAFPALPQQDQIFQQAAKAGVKYVLPSEYGYVSKLHFYFQPSKQRKVNNIFPKDRIQAWKGHEGNWNVKCTGADVFYSMDSQNDKICETVSMIQEKRDVQIRIKELGMKFIAVVTNLWTDYVSCEMGLLQ